jgi:hypothetical protein
MAARGENRAKLHVLGTPDEPRHSRSKTPPKSWDRVNKPYSARKAPRKNRKFSDKTSACYNVVVSATGVTTVLTHQGIPQTNPPHQDQLSLQKRS